MAQSEFPNSVIQANQEQESFSGLKFPADLGSHGMMLLFKSYSYTGTFGLNRQRSSGNYTGSVFLPVPTNLVDNISINVGSDSMGAMGALLSDALNAPASELANIQDIASGAVSQSFEMGKTVGNAVSSGDYGAVFNSLGTMASSAERAMKYFGRNIGDQLMPGAGVAFDIASGTTVNPHVTLNFDGVGLKKHSFSWNLSPKSQEETNTLREIVTLIKRESHPAYKDVTSGDEGGGSGGSLSRGLLTYPSLVDIFFVGVNPGYFYYFKPAMITNISVNYAPNGIAINKDGSPTIVTLQVDVQEASIHTKADY